MKSKESKTEPSPSYSLYGRDWGGWGRPLSFLFVILILFLFPERPHNDLVLPRPQTCGSGSSDLRAGCGSGEIIYSKPYPLPLHVWGKHWLEQAS